MSEATFNPRRHNPTKNTPFSRILEREISRRRVLRSSVGLSALGIIGGFGLAGCSGDSGDTVVVLPPEPNPNPNPDPDPSPATLGFNSIDGSLTDSVVVPEGYSAQVLAPWGTPLNSRAAAWKNDGSNTAEDQLNAVGMNHDGIRYYPLNNSSTDGILCINHEFLSRRAIHPNGATEDDTTGLRNVPEEARKEINAHGVTVVRVRRNGSGWEVVTDDEHNRRFTAATDFEIAGPLAGHASMVTPYSTDGMTARGTLNNCGNGFTPWGTYLTCEENWPEFFTNLGTLTADQIRIGIGDFGTRYSWEELAGDASEENGEFRRFDITPSGSGATEDYRNEANGHGFVVEIDPYNPDSPGIKRTALGRFRHESVAYGIPVAGKPLAFYSGHDSRFEYLYKFVSAENWDPADASRSDRLAVGAKYMDVGTLYAARFDENGIGEWLPLTPDGGTLDGGTLSESFEDQAEIILNTAGAADLVGATPMDRPEWIATDPMTGDVYLSLTNNGERTGDNEDTGTNPANPRLDNAYGHIIRWQDDNDEPTRMTWDFAVFGSPDDGDEETNLSGLTELNQFASPDGLVFDDRGILWIQTDNGADAVKEDTNDQMLALVPATLVNSEEDVALVNSTNQHLLRRFFVGPNGCEVTGLTYTPDYTTFFANIQHPGNWPISADATEETPAETSIRSRSATVVITKDDGGQVGL
ncbi:MAG: PhoX family phosphatase [Gammaproteobacteria bacterium]|nr:PhoX family phosphatase [Gammaproteobacteria bacterium]